MAVVDLIQETISQHIANPKVISYGGTKKDEVRGRFVSANRIYNFVLNRKGVSYSPAGRNDSLVFSALFLERLDAVKRPKIGDRVGNNVCKSGKSYQCGKTCISNLWNCRKGVKDVNDARRIASILASTNEGLKAKASGEVSEKALARGKVLSEARVNRAKNGKPERVQGKNMTKKESSTNLLSANKLDMDSVSRYIVSNNDQHSKSTKLWAERSGLANQDGSLTETGKLVKENDPFLSSETSQWAMHTELSLGAKEDKDGWRWFNSEFLPDHYEFSKETLTNAAQKHFGVDNVTGRLSKILDAYTSRDGLRKVPLVSKVGNKYQSNISTDAIRQPSVETEAFVVSRIIEKDFKNSNILKLDELAPRVASIFGISTNSAEDLLDRLSGAGFVDQSKTVPPFQVMPRWKNSTELLSKAYKKEMS